MSETRKVLERVRQKFESDLVAARNERVDAIGRMTVADAKIMAVSSAIDRIDEELGKLDSSRES